MTSAEEVAESGQLWVAHCQKVDSIEENALRELRANTSPAATHGDKAHKWEGGRYASRSASPLGRLAPFLV